MYIRIECMNNKSLAQCIDQLRIEKMHVITEISKLSTHFGFDPRMIVQ